MLRIPRLHVITDTELQARYTHMQLAQLAWAAGGCAVQYRNKRFDLALDMAEAQAIARHAQATHNCLIVNDSVALAGELNAQGLHLGREDGDPRAAAELLGPEVVIGATVHSLAELAALHGAAIHYIGVGPVYGTRSKSTGLPDLGLDGLAAICAASPWPVIAIGGIELRHVPEVLAAGAHGVAILSAFCLADDPTAVAADFLAKLGHD